MASKLGAKIKEKYHKIKKFFKENTISALTAVFLGVATLLVAWAGWIGSLHGGNQAGNYTRSNNLAAESSAEYNIATQVYISDLFTWNTISSLQLDKEIAEQKGDQAEVKLIKAKIEKIKQDSCSPKLLEALNQMAKDGVKTSPFEDEAFTSGYFESANKLQQESKEALEEGNRDNNRGDSYQLASVMYSLVLFLLGIIGVLNDRPTRKALLTISIVILAVAFIYMLTIPMPTGFSFANFFNHS